MDVKMLTFILKYLRAKMERNSVVNIVSFQFFYYIDFS